MEDLVILVPDSAYKEVLPPLLGRHQSLGIRPVSFKIVPDPFHDSSVQAVELLRPFQSSHQRALVVRDIEGSGHEQEGAVTLEKRLRDQLIASGWQRDHAAALVLEPELESWLRFGSVHMGRVLEERARQNRVQFSHWETDLRRIRERHGGDDGYGKPLRPREVFRELLKVFGIPPSNAVLGKLAEKESLRDCKTASFLRFCELLRQWFPLRMT